MTCSRIFIILLCCSLPLPSLAADPAKCSRQAIDAYCHGFLKTFSFWLKKYQMSAPDAESLHAGALDRIFSGNLVSMRAPPSPDKSFVHFSKHGSNMATTLGDAIAVSGFANLDITKQIPERDQVLVSVGINVCGYDHYRKTESMIPETLRDTLEKMFMDKLYKSQERWNEIHKGSERENECFVYDE